MQELSNAKLSSAYLNGLKDSLQNSGTGQDGGHAIQDLLRAASLLGGFGFSTSSKAPAESGSSSKTEANPASDNQQQQTSKTPTPENGQTARASEHRGNGKSTHDEASEDSGMQITSVIFLHQKLKFLQFRPDADSMDEDDSMIDSDDGWAGTGEGDDARKRSADGDDGRPSKRRRFVSDESAHRIPLTLGWKRETLIRAIGKSGVRGEVTYYSPSGRRFRQYPDVVRYLERQGTSWHSVQRSERRRADGQVMLLLQLLMGARSGA